MKATGSTPEEILASFTALQKTKPCAGLEKERQQLLSRYKRNKYATMALQNHVGFSGIDRYPAAH